MTIIRTFTPSATSETLSFPAPIIDDSIHEIDEVFQAEISNTIFANTADQNTFTLTQTTAIIIIDDDDGKCI